MATLESQHVEIYLEGNALKEDAASSPVYTMEKPDIRGLAESIHISGLPGGLRVSWWKTMGAGVVGRRWYLCAPTEECLTFSFCRRLGAQRKAG